MKKLGGFLKKEYKILIPIMVVIVLLIAVYFLYREYKYDSYRDKEEVSVYQYFGGNRVSYKLEVTYNLKKAIVGLSPIDRKIDYDATPIYLEDDDKVIFPEEMSIVFPLRDGEQYKLYKYATYERDGEVSKIKVNDQVNNYSYFFLYDGEGTYFFPDDVELKIGNDKIIKLGKMSYVSRISDYTLVYYDKENDESEIIDYYSQTVNVINEDMDINIRENYFLHFGKKVLLFKPYGIDSVLKMD